jgi:hypothetical protein
MTYRVISQTRVECDIRAAAQCARLSSDQWTSVQFLDKIPGAVSSSI